MELIIVLVIALVVLGPKRLPEVGKSLGRSMREFKGAIGGEDDDEPEVAQRPAVTATTSTTPAPAAAPAPAAEREPDEALTR